MPPPDLAALNQLSFSLWNPFQGVLLDSARDFIAAWALPKGRAEAGQPFYINKPIKSIDGRADMTETERQ